MTLTDQTALWPIAANCGDPEEQVLALGAGIAGSTGHWATTQLWRREPLDAQGYRVCWCASSKNCSDVTQFQTQVGIFHVKDLVSDFAGDLIAVAISGNATIGFALEADGYRDVSSGMVTVLDVNGDVITYSAGVVSTASITCSEPGCSADAELLLASDVLRHCRLSASIFQTDFVGTNERLEWIKVQGLPVLTDCRPGKACETSSEFYCLQDFDISSFIPDTGSVLISAKISQAVDSCPKSGSYLHMNLQLSCLAEVARESAESFESFSPLPNASSYTDPFGTFFAINNSTGRGHIEMSKIAYELSSHQCSVGHLCVLRLPGWGTGAGRRHALRLLRTNVSCGATGAVDGVDGISSATGLGGNFTADAESDGLFVLGTPVGYDVEVSFKICLGIDPEEETDFQFHMGHFFLIGPYPQQHQNCTALHDCLLGPFAGQLSSIDLVAFVPMDHACGDQRDSFVASNTAHALSAALDLSLSGKQDLPVGGVWRLCFCTAMFEHCDDASDFRVDAGLLVVAGPNNLQQDQFCFAGHACHLGPFSGQNLSDADKLALTSSGCDAASLSSFSNVSNVNEYRQVILSANETRLGSNWVMCYCTALSRGCVSFGDFTLQVGHLVIRGPSPLEQHMQCHVAEDCILGDFTGHWLSPSDRLAAVSASSATSCGDAFSPLVLQGSSKPVFLAASGDCTQPHRRNCTVRSFLIGLDAAGAAAGGDLPYGGTWRICYCPSHEGCRNASSYAVEVGMLTVHGPPNRKVERTCVAGDVCEIANMSSLDLQDSSSLMLLDTCGQQPQSLMLSGWPQGGISLPSDGETVSWGASAVIAAGSDFRLCWCRNSTQCSLAGDFRVDIGSLRFVGPHPISLAPHPVAQDRTCVSGQPCALVGVSGNDLSESEQFLVMHTCGSEQFLVSLPSSTSTERLLTVPGGQYRLCWCSSMLDCLNSTDFRVDIGSIFIQGPAPLLQDRTCVAGRTCFVNMTGILSPRDRLLVQNTCGDVQGTVMRWPNAGLSWPADSLFSWGEDIIVSSAGGIYRLCWCTIPGAEEHAGEAALVSAAGQCSAAEDFLVDVGALTLIGPGPQPNLLTSWTASVEPLVQQRTCISGLECDIHGLTGTHLSTQDSFMVLNTCGHHAIIPRAGCLLSLSGYVSEFDHVTVLETCGHHEALVQKFPLEAQANGLISHVSASGALFAWVDVSSAGGQYRLCWCSSFTKCSTAEDYQTDLGALHLVGPFGHTSAGHRTFTCFTGQVCDASGVSGLYLSENDAYAVHDTCGEQLVPRFPEYGRSVSTGRNGDSTVFAGVVLLTVGLYRLCWCAEKKDIPGYTTDASSCATDFGSLHLLGPLLEQHSTCVSGQSCLLPDMSFFGGTAGPSMTPLPGKLAVLETCGVASRVRGFPLSQLPLSNSENPIGDFYSDQISTAGGQYSLCWCAATPGPCLEDDEFLVSVGHIYIIGPHQLLQKTCISGQKCRLDGLLGTSISDEDSLLIADTCGTYTSLIPQAVNAGLATELPSGKIAMWGREAMTSAGGQYRMCWCSRLSRCSESTDFVTDMGSLVIVGPTPLHLERTCLAGFDCTIDLAGKYLSNGDQMLLSETCGVASSPVPAFQAVHLTVTLGFGALVSWDNDLEMPGSYRLCWCSTESPCLVAEDFKTDVGMLTVVGLGLQDKTCVSGLPCNIDISESSISPEDHFLVMQTCGTIDGAIDGFPGAVSQVGSNEALLSWGRFLALPVTAAGGLYRLCWCPRPNTLSKSQELVASCGDSARPTVSLPFLPNAIT
ncbi:Alpha-agarase [Durusdinium trenchii]|uniref:Alpha-agarase n=1 Tax=Durusdinium trenchii TaxID=1381693 RepID=A0ABP0SBT1_9DINO